MKMKYTLGLMGFMLMAATAPAQAAPAAVSNPITLTSGLKLDKVITENGVKKHVLVEPKKVIPGDNLVFTTEYRNSGTTAFNNFVVTNPLPSAVVLSGDGFGSFDVSVDGGKSFGKLVTLTVADGKGGKRPAQSTDVSHLRWTIATIPAGASGKLEYHGVVR